MNIFNQNKRKFQLFSLLCEGDAEELPHLRESDDLCEPERTPLPAGGQRGAGGGSELSQSQLGSGLWASRELGEEAALGSAAVSGQQHTRHQHFDIIR